MRIATWIVLGLATLGVALRATVGNHWSYDIRPLALAWVVAAAVFRDRHTIFLSTLGMSAIALLDQFNLLVEYELWLKRGMPEPWS